MPTLGASLGRRLPDAILHGKRSFRPRSRAVQDLAVPGLSSEAFQLAWNGDCVTTPTNLVQPRLRFLCASAPFAPGRPPFLAVRWPGATGLASYLSGRVRLAGQRCKICIANSPESFHRSCLNPCLSQPRHSLCPTLAGFELRTIDKSPPSCLSRTGSTVAAVNPLGNCDSHRVEALLYYLTRLGTASHRS
jgi:hypothetical protein